MGRECSVRVHSMAGRSCRVRAGASCPPPEGMTCLLRVCAVLSWGAARSAWFPEGTFPAQRLSKVIKEIIKIPVSPRTDKI